VKGWVLGARVVLALVALSVGAAYAAVRIHEQANIVDLEVLPSPTAPVGAQPVSVLPRDIPSREVREHIDFSPAGGPPCVPPNRGGLAISVGFDNQVTIGTRTGVCSEGFVSGKAVSVRISGHGSNLLAESRPEATWTWDVPPRTAPGRYLVQEEQGPRAASAHMRVINSSRPFVRIRSLLRSRTTFEIVVGGAPPDRRVPVYVYRGVNPTGYGRDYFSTVGVRTDDRGNGSTTVRGTGGSTFTCYGVVPGFRGNAIAGEDQFCFGRPDLE